MKRSPRIPLLYQMVTFTLYKGVLVIKGGQSSVSIMKREVMKLVDLSDHE